MKQVQDDIKAFMQGCDQECPDTVQTQLPRDIRDLRMSLIREEARELLNAIDVNDLEGIADGICDLVYVAVGSGIAYGLDMVPFWEEVQRANMDKLTGPKRADGKQLKPEGWRPPDITGLLVEQYRKEAQQ